MTDSTLSAGTTTGVFTSTPLTVLVSMPVSTDWPSTVDMATADSMPVQTEAKMRRFVEVVVMGETSLLGL